MVGHNVVATSQVTVRGGAGMLGGPGQRTTGQAQSLLTPAVRPLKWRNARGPPPAREPTGGGPATAIERGQGV